MKLRIRGNSIRLRLTKGEVEEFRRSRRVVDKINFGPSNELAYELVMTVGDGGTKARLNPAKITIAIPEDEALAWVGSDQTGIESTQSIGEDQFLRVLVEKDFACISVRAGEDDSDAFPNPFLHAEC